MKHKTFTLILLLITAGFVAEASPVDVRTAREAAYKFVNANAKTPLRGADELQLAKTYNINRGDAAFYVFNTPSGFVIVSADDCAYPILGYSDEGRPFNVNSIPIQLQDILQEYTEQIQYAVEHNLQPDESTAQQWRLVKATGMLCENRDRTQVGPLLTTTWDQGQYYNAMCPEDVDGPDGHCVTGCVATAMAQIISYWEYPTQGRGTHSYESNYGTLSVNYYSVMYDYSNMPDTLSSECAEEEINAVAKLISDCGVAVNMGYSAFESGAYDQEARAALINFFKYSPDLSFAEKDFFSTEEWSNMLRAELDASRVIYYSGQGTGGHAFVCDGYNSDGYYHFNFGWSGNGNSWYLLDAVYPLGMDFNISQAAILGIVPDANGDVVLGQINGTSTFVVEEPLEFYHIMGHNLYEGYNYGNPCNNTVNFIPVDTINQIVVDIMEYEDQNLTINDGNGAWLRSLSGGDNNDLSPVVSSSNAISLIYFGNLFYDGFKVIISQESDCRMVSNVCSSVEATTVHLSWTENGNATQWNVEYGLEGFALGSGTLVITQDTVAEINDLAEFVTYDFYIRPVCGGSWFGPITIIVAPYWDEVVTNCPEGYVFDEITNTAEISTPEGLTWWAKNGCKSNVVLTADIDLDGYKWRPANVNANIVIDGQNHIIYNLYSAEYEGASLIRQFFNGVIRNLGVEDFNVISEESGAAALCAAFHGTMYNCHVKDGYIKGNYKAGGLVSDAVDCDIINCYAEATVDGYYSYGDNLGVLIGESLRSNIRNCYTYNPDTYVSVNPQHYAGIVGRASEGQITNCYSLDAPLGLVGFSFGTTYFSDTSSFYGNELEWTLRNPVTFGSLQVDDLCQALNMGVAELNENGLNLWETDNQYLNNGYPVYGETYQVTCSNVSDIVINNVITSQGNAVMVSWSADSEETEWQIKYRRHDLSTDAVIINTTNNPLVIYDIPLAFEYDFNIRAVCGTSNYSGWSPTITKVIDKPYWTDIVTSRPDGYFEDSEGNIYISTAEGLSWLSSESNGINTSTNYFYYKQVYLTNDIDISQYSWYPIMNFYGNFDGCGHKISGIYINSNDFFYCGLFGSYYGDTLQNIIMDGGLVKNCNWDVNNGHTGSIVGIVFGETTMVNCHSSVNVEGMDNVGGLVGEMRFSLINCSTTGNVTGRGLCGGLLGFAYGDIQINNCYATGDIIYKDNDAGAWALGGLIGQAQFIHTHNCYSTGDIVFSGGFEFVGKLIGLFDITGDGAYLYGLEDNTLPSMFGGGFMLNYQVNCQDTARFSPDGILDNAITIGEVSCTVLLDALNAWVDANNTNGEYLHWVADTAMVNGGFPILGQLTATKTQTAEFSSGWSWYSTYIEQSGIDGLAMLENSMDTACSRIQSRTEFIDNLEYMGYHFWDGTLSAITNEQSYRIRTTSPCEATITGQPALPENHPITVNPGWNWIGFPSAQPLSVTSALSAFAPEVNDQIKGRYNFATYLGNYGGVDYWDGLLTTLEPGQGYMYRSFATTPKTFVYQTGSKVENLANGSTEGNYYKPVCEAYADNMTVTAEVELNEPALRRAQGPESFELAAFAGNECRGSVKLKYVALLDRYEAFLMVFGDGGEELSFVLTDGEETYWSNEGVVFSANAILGNPTEPFVLHFGSTSVSDKLAQSLRVYPNPVECGECFSIGLNDSEERPVRIEMVNALGALVKAETMSQWPARLVAPETAGVYTLKVIVDDKTVVCRRLVVR